MSELEDFRQSTRAFIAEHAPKSLYGTRHGRFDGFWGGREIETRTGREALVESCLARGLTAPTWPAEFGGGGRSRDQARFWDEELERLALPPPLVGVGLTMIGPTLLDYGTEEQQREHLPPIVRGEVRWAQGYSEPGAGSDLAALSTRAVRDGEFFVVNGQKTWTTHADKSDFIFALVRTNPGVKKQLGISFLLIDMETPGVSTRPIELISGWSPFCETFFDNVRVPARNVVGAVDAGWTVAKALLNYERSMIGEAMSGDLATAEGELVTRARRSLGAPRGPLPDAILRQEIAQTAMDIECFALVIAGLQQAAQKGQKPGPESSTLKIIASELKQRRWDLGVRAAGADGLGWEGPNFEERDLATTREWLRSRANTIEGGTSEIQLNIIAKQVLGLGIEMKLIRDEEQVELARTVRDFVAISRPLERLRQLRDTRDALGFSRAEWKRMADLGWTGIGVPEEWGGTGLGFTELCIVLEEAGRKLMPEPLLSTLLLGAQSLLLGGTPEQKRRFLPRIAAGDAIVTLAYEERQSRHDPGNVETVARRSSSGARLHGEKVHVLDAPAADALIVSAREPAGLTLFLIDAKAPGVEISPERRIDSRSAALVRLNGVEVDHAASLGPAGSGLDLLRAVIDRAAVGLSAEMLGAASQAFEDTVEYLKARRQFDVPIGSFQALQHRAARLLIELTLARAAVTAAARSVDEQPDRLPRLAALAKARASDTFMRVASEGVQMHGGIGVTDEFHMGFYLKRARAAELTFGDAAWHRRRWAELAGY